MTQKPLYTNKPVRKYKRNLFESVGSGVIVEDSSIDFKPELQGRGDQVSLLLRYLCVSLSHSVRPTETSCVFCLEKLTSNQNPFR